MRESKCTSLIHRHMLTHRQRLTRSLSMKYCYKLDPQRARATQGYGPHGGGMGWAEWAEADGGGVSFAALF